MISASNRQQTLLRKLNRKKHRYSERLFFVEGDRAVRQIAGNQVVTIKTLFFDDSQHYWTQDEWLPWIKRLDARKLDTGIFHEVTDTENPQGVLALCEMPDETTVSKLCDQEGIIIALDSIQDPGNVGTIIRTASWFGAAALLSGKGTVDLFHPKVVRSTAGATGAVGYLNGDLLDILPEFEENDWSVILLNKSSDSAPLSEVQANRKTIVVVGNEAHGIDNKLIKKDRTQAVIPAFHDQPAVESLNAAIATSIALYSLTID
ncbi:RNA methyltransferase [Aliifodinibius salicampi]|uniref:RNA methyltransferase n=1 Tax=Fodinibius salicampi TaxID=1920655 RepID=A0ABT3Q384_9BACT|nr:RNA methyltransferase [Fodinibius salicampi]MCW9714511.1 RNA methyltransferase [Fodinibius salicampi]